MDAVRNIEPAERLIFALDVPSSKEALDLVDELEGVVSFFKVGLELLLAGGLKDLLERLIFGKHVFVDLKLPGDLGETIRRVVALSAEMNVRFLTLSASADLTTIGAAAMARGDSEFPKLLMVPFLSSLDEVDLHAIRPDTQDKGLEEFMRERSALAIDCGCDGLIVSGPQIGAMRQAFPDAIIVSPGIRPSWTTANDHKRHATPAEAIKLGADYLVVGRPIRNAGSKEGRRDAAQRVIDEIAESLAAR